MRSDEETIKDLLDLLCLSKGVCPPSILLMSFLGCAPRQPQVSSFVHERTKVRDVFHPWTATERGCFPILLVCTPPNAFIL